MKNSAKYIIIAIICLVQIRVNAQHYTSVMKSMKDLVYNYDSKFISLNNDIELSYIEEGSGNETVLFIHGLGSYIPAWNKNLESLKDFYKCIAIDLPGYGKSSKENYSGSMEFYADVIHEFCQKKSLGQVILAGHSMGGQISMVTALKYPTLVKKLILIAPAGFEVFNKGEKQWFRDVMTVDGVRLTTVENIRLNLAYNFYQMPADAEFMVKDRIEMRGASDFPAYCYAITQSVKGMVDQAVFDFLPDIKQPALCIFGENDNLIPNRFLNGGPTRKFAEKGASRMPNCSLKLIPKAGHFVMYEKSEEVNSFIREFLR